MFFQTLSGAALLMLSSFAPFVMRNCLLQLMLFLPVACVPAHLTGNMSYVDIAWPWGLFLMGIQSFVYGTGYAPRVYAVSALFVAAGLRMGVPAVLMWSKGWLKNELPRYQYQRRRWEKHGVKNIVVERQKEILVQAFANTSVLSTPILLQAFNPAPGFEPLELVGYAMWFAAIAFETVADVQKQNFIKAQQRGDRKKQLCNVGLWRYSRHPNYFGEWMVWNSLIVSSLPSLVALYHRGSDHPVMFFVIAGSLFFISRAMYVCLVYYTGAVPAEYYSVQKRPEYKVYQSTTNMFFPWFPKASQQ